MWIKNKVISYNEARRRKKRQWNVSFYPNYTCLYCPLSYQYPHWSKWGKMQVKILSKFQEHWQETHTYIRFQTYLPEHFGEILVPGIFEEIAAERKNEYVYLFPDCQDKHIWETVLSVAGLLPFTRTFFILNQRPSNWQETMNRLFKITQMLSENHSISEFESDLAICRCLCYSMDEFLILAKVDLPENSMLSILESVAKEEGLELIAENKH